MGLLRIALALLLAVALPLEGIAAGRMQIGKAEVLTSHAAITSGYGLHEAHEGAFVPNSTDARPAAKHAGCSGCAMTCCQPAMSSTDPLPLTGSALAQDFSAEVHAGFLSWAESVPHRPPRT